MTQKDQHKKLGDTLWGIANFSTDTDTLGDSYEYLIGQFAAGSGKKTGDFYTPTANLNHSFGDCHLRQSGSFHRNEKQTGQGTGLCLRFGFIAWEKAY